MAVSAGLDAGTLELIVQPRYRDTPQAIGRDFACLGNGQGRREPRMSSVNYSDFRWTE